MGSLSKQELSDAAATVIDSRLAAVGIRGTSYWWESVVGTRMVRLYAVNDLFRQFYYGEAQRVVWDALAQGLPTDRFLRISLVFCLTRQQWKELNRAEY